MTGAEYVAGLKSDPRFNSPHRQPGIDLLTPVVQSRWMDFQRLAGTEGRDVRLLETHRGEARQLDCFNRGKSKLRKVGTHGFCLALDFGLYVGGRLVEDGEAYSFAPRLARAAKLVSGYDWGAPSVKHSWVDPDHLQLITVADQSRLFSGKWFPPDDYDAYAVAVQPPLAPQPGWDGGAFAWEPGAWPGVPFAVDVAGAV